MCKNYFMHSNKIDYNNNYTCTYTSKIGLPFHNDRNFKFLFICKKKKKKRLVSFYPSRRHTRKAVFF